MQGKRDRITIGILIDWIVGWGDDNYYQSLIVSGLSVFAKEKDLNVMCLVTGRVESPNEWERCRNLLFKFVDKNKVDGLIIPTPAIGLYSNSAPILKLMESYRDIPIVTLGETHRGYHSVIIDNYSGMRQIVDHMIETHGYKRIAFIKGPSCPESEIRFRAYVDALTDHGLPYSTELVYNGTFLYESGMEAVKSFRQRNIQFDALVCSNDNMAMGALMEFNKTNENHTGTLPITGFDDVDASRIYGLTTVRQSFYEETRKAAEMLLTMIQGKDTPMEREVPSKMVLRSSCGCVSEVVRNTYSGSSLYGQGIGFEEQRDKIINEFIELNNILEYGEDSGIKDELLNYEVQVLEAFYREFENQGINQFVFSVNKLILWAVQSKINYFFTQDVLSIIRRNVMKGLRERTDIITAENLFHAARVQIFDVLQTAGVNRVYLNPLYGELSEQLGEDLMASLDYGSQMNYICRILPTLGVSTCYIALFENPLKPLERSKLILGMTSSNCYKNGGGILFNTTDLLPEPFLSDLYSKRFSVVIQVLHQGDNQIGYVILDISSTINKNLEIIRYRLSVSLNATTLIDRISKQAVSLERQVIERTVELSESNRNLLEEVVKRKTVEEQLKKALNDLEYYNAQLHIQSIRDDLTQLYNRRGFMKLGTEYYLNAKESLSGFLLLYADLDGLKMINDQFGHSEGDTAISAAADILNKAFRNTDIISRLGGDEFIVLIPGACPRDEADIRKRLSACCESHNAAAGKLYQLSMSVGCAFYTPGKDLSFEDLMKEADKNLYRDKLLKKGEAAGN